MTNFISLKTVPPTTPSTTTTMRTSTTSKPLNSHEFKTQILSDKRISQRMNDKDCIGFKNHSIIKVSCDSDTNEYVNVAAPPPPSTPHPYFNGKDVSSEPSLSWSTNFDSSIPILVGSVFLSLGISTLTLVKLLSLCRRHNRPVRSDSSSIQEDQDQEKQFNSLDNSMQMQTIHHHHHHNNHVQTVSLNNKSCLKTLDRNSRPINSHLQHHHQHPHQNTSLCSCSPASSPLSFTSTAVSCPVYQDQRHQVYSQTLNPHQNRVHFDCNSLNRHEDQLEMMKRLFHDHHHQELASLTNLTNPSMAFIPQHIMAQEVPQDHHLNQHVLQVSFSF